MLSIIVLPFPSWLQRVSLNELLQGKLRSPQRLSPFLFYSATLQHTFFLFHLVKFTGTNSWQLLVSYPNLCLATTSVDCFLISFVLVLLDALYVAFVFYWMFVDNSLHYHYRFAFFSFDSHYITQYSRITGPYHHGEPWRCLRSDWLRWERIHIKRWS